MSTTNNTRLHSEMTVAVRPAPGKSVLVVDGSVLTIGKRFAAVDLSATERPTTICEPGGAAWKPAFSFGRALQDAALKTWRGLPANVAKARAALRHRTRCNRPAVQEKSLAEAKRSPAWQQEPR